jgi:hypothetical protein
MTRIPEHLQHLADSVSHTPNFALELQIDPMALDIEFMDQPAKFYKYAEMLAEANKDYDASRLRFEVIQAQVDGTIRAKYAQDSKKPTETAIRGEVVQDADYQAAYEELANKRQGVETLSAGVKAFEQRKVSLENMAKLWAQSYYAGPSSPRDISGEFKKRQEEIKNKLAQLAVNRGIK